MKAQIVHLLSGGLDSVTLLYEHLRNGSKVVCIAFDYGQTHRRELDCARAICRKLGVELIIVELSRVKNLFLHCALTDGKGSNVVPNRNAVMLNIAAAIAASIGAQLVTYGCNRDDREQFPDCRPAFVAAMNACLEASGTPVEICAPYSPLSKRQIVQRGRMLGVPFEETWSCYKGGNKPCGKCSACKLRQEAMR